MERVNSSKMNKMAVIDWIDQKSRTGALLDDWFDCNLTDDEWVEIYGPIVEDLIRDIEEPHELLENDSRQQAIDEVRDDVSRSPEPEEPKGHQLEMERCKRSREDDIEYDTEAVLRQVQREIDINAKENFRRITGLPC